MSPVDSSRLMFVVAVVASCGPTEPGVLIEAKSDGPAKRFELIYSLATCPECTEIAPPSRSLDPIHAVGWLTDETERFVIEHAEASDTARFQLKTVMAQDLLVERAILLAFAGETATDREEIAGVATIGPFKVPAIDSVKFEVELLPADGAFDMNTGKEHVEVWHRELPPSHPACVVVQHPDGAEFFGWKEDPDCDDPKLGQAGECTEFGYLGLGPPQLSAASCRVKDFYNRCRIGGPACMEAAGPVPPNAMCLPIEPSYCMPEHICNTTCTNTFDQNCLGAILITAPTALCDVFTSGGAPCAPVRTNWSLQNLVADTVSKKCKSIEIATISQPLTFGTRVTVGDGGSSAVFTIDPVSFNEGACSIDVTWSGTLNYAQTALVKVVTDTGVNRVVPWRLQYKGQVCNVGQSFTCSTMQGAPSDSYYTCQ